MRIIPSYAMPKFKLTVICLFIVLTGVTPFAHAGPDSSPKLTAEDLDGAPKSGLASSTFATVTGVKLTKAKVIWHLKSAFAMPEHLIDQKLLDCCAYLKPAENILGEPPVDRSDEKVMYADGYGGPGLNHNWGGGRAPITGKLQIKGMGRTEFVNMAGRDAQHSSGYYPGGEAVTEAIWSEIANREAPWGANRVVALIDTGVLYTQDGHTYRPAVLLIREDMLRPAHFIDNPNIDSADHFRRDRDRKRVTENQAKLPELLPPSRFGSERTLENGLKEFAARVAEQDAYLFANRIQHGAASPSNADLSGKLLDLSTQTSLPGWNKLYAVDPVHFGDNSLSPDYVLKPLIESLRVSDAERAQLMSTLRSTYFTAYEAQARFEFLKVLGLPENLARRLKDERETENLVKALRVAIDHVYQVPAETFWVHPEAGPIDFANILVELAKSPNASVEAQLAKLSQLPEDQAKQIAFALNAIYAKALKIGGSKPALLAARITTLARERNRKRELLYRNREAWDARDLLVEHYRVSGDGHVIADYIDKVIASETVNPRLTGFAGAYEPSSASKSRLNTESRSGKLKLAPALCADLFHSRI